MRTERNAQDEGSRFFSSVPSEWEEMLFQRAKHDFVEGTQVYGFGAVCYMASVVTPGKEEAIFLFFNYVSKVTAGLLFLNAAGDARKVDRVSARLLTAHSAASAAYIIASEILMANLSPFKTPFNHDDLTYLKIFLNAVLLTTDCYTAYKMNRLDTEYERFETSLREGSYH